MFCIDIVLSSSLTGERVCVKWLASYNLNVNLSHGKSSSHALFESESPSASVRTLDLNDNRRPNGSAAGFKGGNVSG